MSEDQKNQDHTELFQKGIQYSQESTEIVFCKFGMWGALTDDGYLWSGLS